MLEPPYELIADGLKDGTVVPFFGAAASAAYRPNSETWQPGKSFLPFGGEVAAMLAAAANYPATKVAHSNALSDLVAAVNSVASGVMTHDVERALSPIVQKHIGDAPALALIASWAEHVQGDRRALDRKLRQYFAVDSKPGHLHSRLANVAAARLYITTNYDDLLEKALQSRKPNVLVDRGEKGLWVSLGGDRLRPVAPTGTELYDLLNDPITSQPSRPIIFKMHGSVDPISATNDSYLITEEDYVDFLGRSGGNYIPPYINGLLTDKNFLFLGYSLADWNVRVIMRKLLKAAAARVRFWAIVRGRSDIEQSVWQSQNLNIYPMDLLEFTDKLVEHIE